MTDPEGGGEVAKMHLGRYVWHVSKWLVMLLGATELEYAYVIM